MMLKNCTGDGATLKISWLSEATGPRKGDPSGEVTFQLFEDEVVRDLCFIRTNEASETLKLFSSIYPDMFIQAIPGTLGMILQYEEVNDESILKNNLNLIQFTDRDLVVSPRALRMRMEMNFGNLYQGPGELTNCESKEDVFPFK